jgi:hypothetical protein
LQVSNVSVTFRLVPICDYMLRFSSESNVL